MHWVELLTNALFMFYLHTLTLCKAVLVSLGQTFLVSPHKDFSTTYQYMAV